MADQDPVAKVLIAAAGRPLLESPEAMTALVHASAALRRRQDVLAALEVAKRDPSPATGFHVIGEVSQAALAFHLAVSAARRHCAASGDDPPIDRAALDDIGARATDLRDAVMHWEDKVRRHDTTFLAANVDQLFVNAPPGKVDREPPRATHITWAEYKATADAIRAWAWRLLAPAYGDVEPA